jgi:hypothetical protein
MAWEWLRPILTPNALATVQANPILLLYTVGWLLAVILLSVFCWYISFVTGKAYAKPKDKNAPKKPGAVAGLLGKVPFLKK